MRISSNPWVCLCIQKNIWVQVRPNICMNMRFLIRASVKILIKCIGVCTAVALVHVAAGVGEAVATVEAIMYAGKCKNFSFMLIHKICTRLYTLSSARIHTYTIEHNCIQSICLHVLEAHLTPLL